VNSKICIFSFAGFARNFGLRTLESSSTGDNGQPEGWPLKAQTSAAYYCREREI
jgi:hypothetical protein